jgi:hypothetical protein
MTAAYLDAVADWCAQSRDDVARALADALTCAQLAWLRPAWGGDDPGGPVAAADIAAHVLEAVSGAISAGDALHDRWRSRLGPLGDPVPDSSADVVTAPVLEVGP